MSECLQYQNHTSWATVLSVLSVVVDNVGGVHPGCLKSLLAGLSQLRGYHNFTLHAEVDAIVGRAMRVMGPATVLESIPLNITGAEKDYEFTTSWILPVLRENSPCIFYQVLSSAGRQLPQEVERGQGRGR